jgi:hypothetical protein
MRLKKPVRVSIDQVRITREGNDAIIDHADSGIAGTRLTIGPDIATMTDREIIDVFTLSDVRSPVLSVVCERAARALRRREAHGAVRLGRQAD